MDEVTRFLCDSHACLRARGSLPLGTLKVTRFKVTRIEVPVTREEAQDKVGLR